MLFKRRLENLSDTELISLYKSKGDKGVVGTLYKRYTGFVFAVCLKYLRSREISEDAVMQIFENLFESLQKHKIKNFKSWLYTVAKNHSLQLIRSSIKHEQLGSDGLNSLTPFMESSYNLYHDNEDVLELKISELERELYNLSEEQRVCIELFYLKEKSYQEVAEKTGYTLNQVKSYIQNGKRNLRNYLSDYEEQRG